MTLVIATGGIDLSVGSLMAISGALAPIIFLGQGLQYREVHLAVGVAMIVVDPGRGRVRLVQRLADHAVSHSADHRHARPVHRRSRHRAGDRPTATCSRSSSMSFNGSASVGYSRPAIRPRTSIAASRSRSLIMVVMVALAAWVLKRTPVRTPDPRDRRQRARGAALRRAGRAGQALGLLHQRPLRRARRPRRTSRSTPRATPIWSASAWSSTRSPRSRSAARCSAAAARPSTGTLIGALIIQLVRYTLLANGVPDDVAKLVKAALIVAAVWLQGRGRA